MNIEKDVSVGDKNFIYLKDRLMGGRVFSNPDKSEYLRTAAPAEIAGEINLTKDLYTRGFPVPEVVGSGELKDGVAYYIEKSIGEHVLGEVFITDTKKYGSVSEESFTVFIQIVKKYCEAQFNPKNFVPQDKNTLSSMVVFTEVMEHHPPSLEMQGVFFEVYEKISQKIMALPWGYVQSDLNAFNILPNGVIDFELVGFGPVGYDVITNVYFGRMWPKDRIAYILTDDQIARYISEVDQIAQKNNLPIISSYLDEFLVLKTIWATGKAKGSDSTDFLQWRVRVRDWCIKEYLKGNKIDTTKFEYQGTKE